MDEQRLRAALRQGPPFRTAYLPRPISPDRPPAEDARGSRPGLLRMAIPTSVVVAAVVLGLWLAALTGSNVSDPPPPNNGWVTYPPSATTTPNPTPSVPAAALHWSPDASQRDWPLPVRPEPGGEPELIALDTANPRSFIDPVGDIEPSAPGWLDITKVRIGIGSRRPGGLTGVDFELAEQAPTTFPHPEDRWVAYGLVVDVDGDGEGDLRMGLDNAPDGEHRAWWTDLASGATTASTGVPYGYAGTHFLDTFLPGEVTNGGQLADGEARFGRILLRPEDVGQFKFYVWASMLEDGRMVAIDYAPDVGWLVAGSTSE